MTRLPLSFAFAFGNALLISSVGAQTLASSGSVAALASSPASSFPLIPPAPAIAPSSLSSAVSAEPSSACVETLPEGRARPVTDETFPEKGTAGHVAWLTVRVTHATGDSIMPAELQLHWDSPEGEALRKSAFVLPDGRGPARMSVVRRTVGAEVQSELKIPFVPLPKELGRQELDLPAFPVTLARSSGEVLKLCTKAHRIVVEDPTASTNDAQVKGPPASLPQWEHWTALRQGLWVGGLALGVGALLTYGFMLWRRRPKRLPPPPPPTPPWDAARASLRDLQQRQLVEQGRYDECYAGLSLILRGYLGDLYGFDGRESTSEEVMGRLRQQRRHSEILPQVRELLGDSDLVKFARVVPDATSCGQAFEMVELVVERTERQAQEAAAAVAAAAAKSAEAKAEGKS